MHKTNIHMHKTHIHTPQNTQAYARTHVIHIVYISVCYICICVYARVFLPYIRALHIYNI